MDIQILAAGKGRRSAEQDIVGRYLDRLPWKVRIREWAADSRDAENKLITMIPGQSHVILLDERGRELDSRGWARLLDDIRTRQGRSAVFIIGGAEGVGRAMRERADTILSFGTVTWPHLLVRCMLAEQLYRAYTILENHPYHKD